MSDPSSIYSIRILRTPRSFIREMLKVTQQSEIISFAAGLPEPGLLPVEEMKEAALLALETGGMRALQYSATEGYLPLRQWIVDYYRERGISTSPNEILITSGSQQALDLIAKTFLDPGTPVLLERPSYLGALQAFSLVTTEIRDTALEADGPELQSFEDRIRGARLYYCVPEFQNPSGVQYSLEKRHAVASILSRENTLLIEDDPYRELYYDDSPALPSLACLYNGPSISLGSFSKTVAPGLRLGWIRSNTAFIDKLIVAKQATDLHTSTFNQMVLHSFLKQGNFSERLIGLRRCYRERRDAMSHALHSMLPDADFLEPRGGMFHWVRYPGANMTDAFDLALKEKVAYVPGAGFYAHHPDHETIRLNFTNTPPALIDEGIRRLSRVIAQGRSACLAHTVRH